MKASLRGIDNIFICVLVCAVLMGCKSTVEEHHDISRIIIEVAPQKWVPVTDLNEKAKNYIHEHDKIAISMLPEAYVWIYNQTNDKAILMNYGSGFGQPNWNVYFGRDGAVVGYESGLLGEGEHRQ